MLSACGLSQRFIVVRFDFGYGHIIIIMAMNIVYTRWVLRFKLVGSKKSCFCLKMPLGHHADQFTNFSSIFWPFNLVFFACFCQNFLTHTNFPKTPRFLFGSLSLVSSNLLPRIWQLRACLHKSLSRLVTHNYCLMNLMNVWRCFRVPWILCIPNAAMHLSTRESLARQLSIAINKKRKTKSSETEVFNYVSAKAFRLKIRKQFANNTFVYSASIVAPL